MVPHLFWTSRMGRLATGTSNNFTQKTSPSSSCGSTRDLLLYHHWMVKLATREASILVHSRNNY